MVYVSCHTCSISTIEALCQMAALVREYLCQCDLIYSSSYCHNFNIIPFVKCECIQIFNTLVIFFPI